MVKTNIKKENYTAVADFMLASMEHDLADFTKLFKTIDEEYLSQFKKANEELKNLSSSFLKIEEQKATTQEIYAKADAFRDKLIFLKFYAKRAGIETPLLQDTIKALKSRNIERVVKNTRDMLPFFVQKAESIKDMPSDFLSDIPSTISTFEKKSTQQIMLMSQRKQETSLGKPLYDTLYKYIKEVADIGKLIYKNSPKKDNYTISKILSRIAMASSKKEEKMVEKPAEMKE